MKNLVLHAEKKTPEIILLSNGELVIEGSSLPEDARKFYVPVFQWIEEFKASHPEKANITLDLEYINSTSVRIFLDILRALKEAVSKPENFTVNWKYEKEDVDMHEQGQILEKSLGHTFIFSEKTSSKTKL